MFKKTNKSDGSQIAVSFEIIHLIVVLSKRFEEVFAKSALSKEQVYALAYTDSVGQDFEIEGKKRRIVQRTRMIRILRDIFGCNDTRAGELLNKIEQTRLIEAYRLTAQERMELFGDGQNKVFYVTQAGDDKIKEIVSELKHILTDITGGNQTLLMPPFAVGVGTIAKGIMLFLNVYSYLPRADSSEAVLRFD